MVDPKKLEQAAGKALGDVNAEVQQHGPAAVSIIKKYWYVWVAVVGFLVVGGLLWG